MKKLLWAILATAINAGTNPETCYAKKKSKKNDKKEQVKDTTAKESKDAAMGSFSSMMFRC